MTVDYRLTPNGEALLPALRELTTWAQNNLPAQKCAGVEGPATAAAAGSGR